MSGSYAYIPSIEQTPLGMIHVGWYCAAQHFGSTEPDGCIRTLADVVSHTRESDGEVYLHDANHHGHWAPIFVRRQDLE